MSKKHKVKFEEKIKSPVIILWIVLLFGALTIIPKEAKAENTNWWVKTYGGSGNDYAWPVAIAPNGDLIVAGYTQSFSDSDWGDVWVLRLDANGNVKWQKTYGGSDVDSPVAVAITQNGNIVVAGYTNSFSDGYSDVWVLCLDGSGNVKWQKSYGDWHDDEATMIALTPNGDVIVVGFTVSFGAGSSDFWVLRLDENGNVKWQKTYGGSGEEEAEAVAITLDGDIIVTGWTNSFGAGYEDIWILRLDSGGNIKWQKTYGGSDDERPDAVTIDPNGDIIVASYTGSFENGDFWVFKLDGSGNIKWQKTYGLWGDMGVWAIDKMSPNGIAIAPNGDILLAGWDLLRLSPNGEVKWAKDIGGGGIKVLSDGTAALAGTLCKTTEDLDVDCDVTAVWFNVDEVPNYSGEIWDQNIIVEVYEINAVVQTTNAAVKDSNAKIQDTNADVYDTNAEVETLWSYTPINPSTTKTTTTTATTTTSTSSNEKTNWWVKTYGGNGVDWGNAGGLIPNGDVIVAGGTESFGVGYEDFWVLKLDKGGNVKWQKIYGGSGSEWAISVATADNGDSIVAGFTNSFGAGYDDAWVLRLDANGNVKWQKTYGGNDDDLIRAVTTAPNGDIIATGYTYSFGAGYSDFWVLRLDENGNVKWQMTYGGNDEDYPVAIAVAPNGEIIVTGATLSFGAGGTDVWVLRLDANGNVKWQKTYGGSADEEAYAVAVAENGDIIVAGDTMSFGAGGADFWVLRLDANGNIKWQKAYGGSGDEDAWAIAIVENGDIIVTGESNSFGAGYYDAWLLRLDANGNVKWQKTYGGIDNDDIARAVLIAENSDLIVAGATYSFSVSEADGWVLRLPPDGNLQNCEFCRDSNAQVSETSAEVSTSAAVVGQSNAVVKDTIAEIYDTNANVKTLLAYAPPKDTTTSSRTTTSSTITSSTSTSQGYGTTTTETTEEGDGFEVSVTCGPAAFLVLILIGGAVARIRGRRDD